jgi:hypothetical protein
MENTWSERELPVLNALVQQLDDAAGASFPELKDIIEDTELDISEITKAAIALDGSGYIELVKSGSEEAWFVKGVSKEARQAVGQWPAAEQLLDALVRRLTEAADQEADPEQQSRLRQAAITAGGAARGIFVEVLSSVVAKSMGA